jgi:prepilin-type N-terminal cleavage/methylation domain-containing protein
MSSTRPPLISVGTSPRAVRAHTSRSAFTLIELLTVIAIIGILAAILIPTVGAMRKRAVKAQCASNLRQFGYAINLFRNDNKNAMPSGLDGEKKGDGANDVSLQWIGGNLRDKLIRYGMTFEMLYCNGNTTYRDLWMTEASRKTTGTFPIGYVYLPGTNFTFIDKYGRSSASKYAELADSKIQYRLIAADLNRQYNGSFSNGSNHADTEAPIGGNHLYVDGSVRWYNAATFLGKPALSSDSTKYYFKTEDGL